MEYETPPERLLTAEDLLSGKAAGGNKHSQLWNGTLVLRDPSDGWHAVVSARVDRALLRVATDGWVLGASAGFLVARDPDRVLSPDASFIAKGRAPKPPRAGFIDGAPDLAVEIRAPYDPWAAVVARGDIWIAHGARLVWCIDTDPVVVVALRPDAEPTVHGVGDLLDARPVLKLELAVDDLFERLL